MEAELFCKRQSFSSCPIFISQQQNRVNDNLVSLEPMFLPVAEGAFAARQVLGRARTSVVPNGCARGEKSCKLVLFWERCISVQPTQGLILTLLQLGGLYKAEETLW